MKIKLEHLEAQYIWEMFYIIGKMLIMPRDRKRAFKRVMNKFKNAGSFVDLKPEEIRLTQELVVTNITGIKHTLKTKEIKKEEVKKGLEDRLEVYETINRKFIAGGTSDAS